MATYQKVVGLVQRHAIAAQLGTVEVANVAGDDGRRSSRKSPLGHAAGGDDMPVFRVAANQALLIIADIPLVCLLKRLLYRLPLRVDIRRRNATDARCVAPPFITDALTPHRNEAAVASQA